MQQRCKIGKAAFRAAREMLGLTQSDVAEAADVTVKAVKFWERPDGPEPPEDVVTWLEECLQMQKDVVEAGVSAAVASTQPHGTVQITYYRTQEQYDRCGSSPGPVGMANANARLTAARLEWLGYEVGFAYPDDEDNVCHAG